MARHLYKCHHLWIYNFFHHTFFTCSSYCWGRQVLYRNRARTKMFSYQGWNQSSNMFSSQGWNQSSKMFYYQGWNQSSKTFSYTKDDISCLKCSLTKDEIDDMRQKSGSHAQHAHVHLNKTRVITRQNTYYYTTKQVNTRQNMEIYRLIHFATFQNTRMVFVSLRA